MRLLDGRTARLRPARTTDAEDLVALDHALVADGRGVVQCREQIRNVEEERQRIDQTSAFASAGDASVIAVAEIAPDVVGTSALRQLGPARCRHVGMVSVGVHPAAQRLGLGRALMKYVVEHARARRLERLELYVRADNERAQALYRSLGFWHEGTRARFVKLESGEYVDDLIFSLFLR